MEKKIELTVTEFRQLITETVTATLENAKEKNQSQQPQARESNFYTRKDIMKSYRLRPMEFVELSKREGFPGKFTGRSWRIPKQQFNEWISKQPMELF